MVAAEHSAGNEERSISGCLRQGGREHAHQYECEDGCARNTVGGVGGLVDEEKLGGMTAEVLDRFVSRSSTDTSVLPVGELSIVLGEPSAERSTTITPAVSVDCKSERKLSLYELPTAGAFCSMSCVRMRMRIEEIA